VRDAVHDGCLPAVRHVARNGKGVGHPGKTLTDPWKEGLVASQAAATELAVAGMAQWVWFVLDRWQGKSHRERYASRMKLFSKFPF